VISRLLAVALVAASSGCIRYEYEHEFWLRVDGSGSVFVTGRPELWTAFKALPSDAGGSEASLRDAARALFVSSGLRVRRVTVTHRHGLPYLFVSADFADLSALGGTRAFPDLRLTLQRHEDKLVLEGRWSPPEHAPPVRVADHGGLMAVRFHLPSRIYEHRNASLGVERGNIVSWTQDLGQALQGRPLALGATLDSRSILWSTVTLFAAAIGAALLILGLALWLAARRGSRQAVPPGAA
jgi:hypothetical protein